MQNSNDLLKNILYVLNQINNKTGTSAGAGAAADTVTKGAVASGLLGKLASSDIDSTTKSVKNLTAALKELSTVKLDEKKLKGTGAGLKNLFDSVADIGRKGNIIKNAVNLFDSLTRSMKSITEFSNSMAKLFLAFAGSILMIAGSLWLAGKMLGTTPLGAFGIVTLAMLGLVGIMGLISLGSKFVDPGIKTAQGIGKALLFIAGGFLAFVVSLQLIASILGFGNDSKAVLLAMGMVGAILLGAVGIFSLIGLASPLIMKGNAVVKGMGIGMIVLAGGVAALALAGLFMQSLQTPLKTMGVVILSIAMAAGVMALLGLGAALIIPGILVAMGIGLALVVLALSIKKMVGIIDDIDVKKIKPTVSVLVGGVLGGLIEGVGGALSGGKTGLAGFAAVIKNSTILYSGIALLFGVSLALSQFAKAMTAFVDLGNMRVIEGYTKEGKPIFGQKVDIRGVGKTITATITDFLVGLIDSTQKLTREKAAAMRKMGRALTGRKGILSAVIGFSEALGVFAAFGNKGEIGYSYFEENGIDADGNPKYIEKKGSVPIAKVVGNMVTSFTTFVNELVKNVDHFAAVAMGGPFSPVKRIARTLTGRKGILSAVIGFSEALQTYAKFGKDNLIPILDADGKVIDQISMANVATNIVKTLSTFSEVLAAELDKDDKRNAKQAKKTLGKFDDLITQFDKLAKSQEGLEKVSSTIGVLAQNIGLLSTNLVALDPAKLESISDIGRKAKKLGGTAVGGYSTNVYNNVTNNSQPGPTTAVVSPVSASNEPDWNSVAQIIGKQVAAALKSGQFRFEFATDKSGVITLG